MKSIFALAFVSGLLFAGSAATASVIAPPAPHSSLNVIQVRDGCGRGYHANRWNHCVPNGDRWVDGCDRWHHRDRWGHCIRNW
jgi:hypothetical protein